MDTPFCIKKPKKKLKKILCRKDNLNTSAYRKKVKSAINVSLNKSYSWNSLKANNRALANHNEKMKHDMKRLQDMYRVLLKKNNELTQENFTLQREVNSNQTLHVDTARKMFKEFQEKVANIRIIADEVLEIDFPEMPASNLHNSDFNTSSVSDLYCKDQIGTTEDSETIMDTNESFVGTDGNVPVEVNDMSMILEQSTMPSPSRKSSGLGSADFPIAEEPKQAVLPVSLPGGQKKKTGLPVRVPKLTPEKLSQDVSSKDSSSPTSRRETLVFNSSNLEKTTKVPKSSQKDCISTPEKFARDVVSSPPRRQTFVINPITLEGITDISPPSNLVANSPLEIYLSPSPDREALKHSQKEFSDVEQTKKEQRKKTDSSFKRPAEKFLSDKKSVSQGRSALRDLINTNLKHKTLGKKKDQDIVIVNQFGLLNTHEKIMKKLESQSVQQKQHNVGSVPEASICNENETIHFVEDMELTESINPAMFDNLTKHIPEPVDKVNSQDMHSAEIRQSYYNDFSFDEDGREMLSLSSKSKNTECTTSAIDTGPNEKLPDVVTMRSNKPGTLVFAAARKEDDGSRKNLPMNAPKARSKSKKQIAKQIENLPQEEPKSIFDFHDKTPQLESAKQKSIFDDSAEVSVSNLSPLGDLKHHREKRAAVSNEKIKDDCCDELSSANIASSRSKKTSTKSKSRNKPMSEDLNTLKANDNIDSQTDVQEPLKDSPPIRVSGRSRTKSKGPSGGKGRRDSCSPDDKSRAKSRGRSHGRSVKNSVENVDIDKRNEHENKEEAKIKTKDTAIVNSEQVDGSKTSGNEEQTAESEKSRSRAKSRGRARSRPISGFNKDFEHKGSHEITIEGKAIMDINQDKSTGNYRENEDTDGSSQNKKERARAKSRGRSRSKTSACDRSEDEKVTLEDRIESHSNVNYETKSRGDSYGSMDKDDKYTKDDGSIIEKDTSKARSRGRSRSRALTNNVSEDEIPGDELKESSNSRKHRTRSKSRGRSHSRAQQDNKEELVVDDDNVVHVPIIVTNDEKSNKLKRYVLLDEEEMVTQMPTKGCSPSPPPKKPIGNDGELAKFPNAMVTVRSRSRSGKRSGSSRDDNKKECIGEKTNNFSQSPENKIVRSKSRGRSLIRNTGKESSNDDKNSNLSQSPSPVKKDVRSKSKSRAKTTMKETNNVSEEETDTNSKRKVDKKDIRCSQDRDCFLSRQCSESTSTIKVSSNELNVDVDLTKSPSPVKKDIRSKSRNLAQRTVKDIVVTNAACEEEYFHTKNPNSQDTSSCSSEIDKKNNPVNDEKLLSTQDSHKRPSLENKENGITTHSTISKENKIQKADVNLKNSTSKTNDAVDQCDGVDNQAMSRTKDKRVRKKNIKYFFSSEYECTPSPKKKKGKDIQNKSSKKKIDADFKESLDKGENSVKENTIKHQEPYSNIESPCESSKSLKSSSFKEKSSKKLVKNKSEAVVSKPSRALVFGDLSAKSPKLKNKDVSSETCFSSVTKSKNPSSEETPSKVNTTACDEETDEKSALKVKRKKKTAVSSKKKKLNVEEREGIEDDLPVSSRDREFSLEGGIDAQSLEILDQLKALKTPRLSNTAPLYNNDDDGATSSLLPSKRSLPNAASPEEQPKRRRAATKVNYAEPSLNTKMRRDGEKVDIYKSKGKPKAALRKDILGPLHNLVNKD